MSAIRFKPFEYRFVDENDESYSIAIIIVLLRGEEIHLQKQHLLIYKIREF